MTSYLGLIPLLPLLGAAVLAWGVSSEDEQSQRISGWVATLFAAFAFLVTTHLFVALRPLGEGASFSFEFWKWFSADSFEVSLGLRFDRLASVMCLVITGVGSLIHMYAVGYMDHDKSRPRFFCYLNLFLFSMLMLVLGDSLLVMFVGWEGVGLCSYLLIGFWFTDDENAKAGQKAFVVNRIGDAGFLLGIFTLFGAFGTLNFAELNSLVSGGSGVSPLIIELACAFLFIGAMGKSAQIPLYIWLPDAMAGPTPVSALIHAATMVTAGVYMIARLGAVYTAAPMVLCIICIVGTLTALFAATIAMVQNDIKKVLAYSTVSQLGYMFMALGAGAFSNGIYHVVTHAFFKACLFMGAGSVIVGCHHVQDMREYGGLRKSMKLTFLTYLVATLAIAGIPPLSGFFSKDAILWTVFSNQGLPSQIAFTESVTLAHVLWGMGALTAFLTAFYMTRSLVMTFFGSYRGSEHPHESPWTMTVPLLLLMIPSAAFAYCYGESLMHYLAIWTRPDMALGHEVLAKNHTYHLLEMISVGIAVSGVALAAVIYLFAPQVAASFARIFKLTHSMLENKYWIDEIYQAVIMKPLRGFASILFSVVDRNMIDATVGGLGAITMANGELARRLHGGKITSYAAVMLLSSILIILFWLVL